MITCPMTQREVATGFEADWVTFPEAPFPRKKLRCPACGRTHTWGRRDAFLEGSSERLSSRTAEGGTQVFPVWWGAKDGTDVDEAQAATNRQTFRAALVSIAAHPDRTSFVALRDGEVHRLAPIGRGVAGAWYYGLDCAGCDERIATIEDPAQGRRPNTFRGGGAIAVRCPSCGQERSYGAAAIRNYQVP